MNSLTHETVRQAFAAYADSTTLSKSTLAQHPLVQASLLDGDERYRLSVGIAVRVLLNWAMQQLKAKGNKTALQSHDVLQIRYIEQLSVAEYARTHDLNEQTIEARRKAATKRVAKLLNEVVVDDELATSQQAALIDLRYTACNEIEQRTLRMLTQWDEPLRADVGLDDSFELSTTIPALSRQNLVRLAADGQVVLHPQLVQPLQLQLSAEERQQWNALIATRYAKQNYSLRAATHWLRAAQPQQAVDTLLALESAEREANLTSVRALAQQIDRRSITANSRSEMQLMLGQLAEQAEDLTAAQRNFEQALSASGNSVQAAAHYGLARIGRLQSDASIALMHAGAARRLLSTLSAEADALLYVRTLLLEASIRLREMLDLDEAEEILDTIRPIFDRYTKVDWTPLQADLATAQAMYHNQRGQSDEAIHHYWKAWVSAHAADDTNRAIVTAHNLGSAYFFLKQDYGRAMKYFVESMKVAEAAGNTHSIALNYKGFGYCYWGMGQYDDAADAYLKTYAYAQQANNRSMLASTCNDLAETYAAAGDLLAARQYLEEGYAVSRAIGDKSAETSLNNLVAQYPELQIELNSRQLNGLALIRAEGSLTNRQYQEQNQVSASTALKELQDLVEKKLCRQVGRGRSARYVLVMADS